MKTHESYSPTAGLALDLWATNGQNLVTLGLLARRAVTEQEEQEMAASVHAFAMRSRLPSDMRRAPTGETNDS